MTAESSLSECLENLLVGGDPAVGERGSGLPVARLLEPARASVMWYSVTTVDDRGRMSDRSPIRLLAWRAGQRIRVVAIHRILLLSTSPSGTAYVTQQRHLRIPLGIRRGCRIAPGARLLAAACREHNLLALYPATVVDEALTAYHRAHGEGAGR
jgi:hypothetical protein